MKRIELVALVPDQIQKEFWTKWVTTVKGEVEDYKERGIPKKEDLTAEYSFDSLMQGAKDFGNGLFFAAKGLYRMSSWAVVTIVIGLKWLWKEGVDRKKQKAARKQAEKSGSIFAELKTEDVNKR